MKLLDYIVPAALAVALVSLTGVWLVLLHCRRMKRAYDRSIARQLRMQDHTVRELERVRAEKTALEKLLLTKLPAAGASPEKDR